MPDTKISDFTPSTDALLANLLTMVEAGDNVKITVEDFLETFQQLEGSLAIRLWTYSTNVDQATFEADPSPLDNTSAQTGDIVAVVYDRAGTPGFNFYLVTVGTGNPLSNDVTVLRL